MIERGQGIALWRQIERQLRDEIAAGIYAGGLQMPTEPELAERFGVNRHTVRRAMGELAEKGLVRIEQGRGTFVQEHVIDYMIGRRTRFSEIVTDQKRTPEGRLVRAYETEPPEQAAEDLGIKTSVRCTFLEVLYEADGQPLAVTASYFPAARFPNMIPAFAETRSISSALAQHGVGDYVRLRSRITARMPDPEDAERLQQSRNRPVLVVESVNTDSEGAPIQYSVARWASDRVQLIFET